MNEIFNFKRFGHYLLRLICDNISTFLLYTVIGAVIIYFYIGGTPFEVNIYTDTEGSVTPYIWKKISQTLINSIVVFLFATSRSCFSVFRKETRINSLLLPVSSFERFAGGIAISIFHALGIALILIIVFSYIFQFKIYYTIGANEFPNPNYVIYNYSDWFSQINQVGDQPVYQYNTIAVLRAIINKNIFVVSCFYSFVLFLQSYFFLSSTIFVYRGFVAFSIILLGMIFGIYYVCINHIGEKHINNLLNEYTPDRINTFASILFISLSLLLWTLSYFVIKRKTIKS